MVAPASGAAAVPGEGIDTAALAALLPGVLPAVVAVAVREGDALRAEFCAPEGPRGHDAHADIDREIEERLRPVLQALVPCAFVGEETGGSPALSEAVAGCAWVVDPHDGTREFLQGYRGSAVSIALLHRGTPVLGVVHAFAPPDRECDTIAWAQGCGPLHRNGTAVAPALATGRLDARARVWLTRSSAERAAAFGMLVAPARFVAMASIAYRLARVAAGDGVAAVSVHEVSEYDIAGGAALILAAGGLVLDGRGEAIAFTGNPGAVVPGCFAGAPDAVRELVRRDWSGSHRAARLPPRVAPAFPRSRGVRLSRAQGCLLGQCIGDSLGSLVEFRRASEIAQAYPDAVRDLADGGAFDTLAGQPTDDSELALTLARAIVSRSGFERDAVLTAYRAWLASGPFDAGRTTVTGLAGKPDAASEANGALMRVAPIGIWAAGNPRVAAGAAREDAALTHPNPVCLDASAVFAAAIAAGVGGSDQDGMLGAARAASDGTVLGILDAAADGMLPADYQTHMGWVRIALQDAFCRLMHASDLERGVIATIGCGGDTDTNGAIVGALLGAAHGRDAVPSRWILPVLCCRPMAEVGAARQRPPQFWPDDLLELAEALLMLRTPGD
jgi:ADP-ribosylglycohydrolase/fructose-1,6-bisphosphatase/inositol monophosphatase family enzyme